MEFCTYCEYGRPAVISVGYPEDGRVRHYCDHCWGGAIGAAISMRPMPVDILSDTRVEQGNIDQLGKSLR